MWTGRFSQATADLVLKYGESISYDWKLYRHDIAGSIAHARAQLRAGMLTQEEFDAIEVGLKSILSDIEAGNFDWTIKLEDVHMNIESELTRRIGAPGAKLHTARSRNDQVATDTRLYCRAEIDTTLSLLQEMQRALVAKAEEYAEVRIPGYTHLQRAQPVTIGHHLLAYVEMLGRDVTRLQDCRRRVNVSPLGSGAIAGSTINLDRLGIAAELRAGEQQRAVEQRRAAIPRHDLLGDRIAAHIADDAVILRIGMRLRLGHLAQDERHIEG